MYHFPPAHSSFSKSRYWAWLGLIDYKAPGKKLKPVLQQNSIEIGLICEFSLNLQPT